MTKTETFIVEGMSCNGCSSKLKKALEALKVCPKQTWFWKVAQ